MISSSRVWGRHANVDSPSSGSGPTITAGWHTLLRVWDGQQGRQYVDGQRTNTTATTATGSWTIHRWERQFTGSEKTRRSLRAVLRRGRRRLGRCNGWPPERQSARHNCRRRHLLNRAEAPDRSNQPATVRHDPSRAPYRSARSALQNWSIRRLNAWASSRPTARKRNISPGRAWASFQNAAEGTV
jgi:hypothetical protein